MPELFDNIAYKAIMDEFSRLEIHKWYKGNTHHLAQKLVEKLETALKGKDFEFR